MRGDSRPTDAYLEDVTENEPSFAAGLSARYKLLQHACTETRGDGLSGLFCTKLSWTASQVQKIAKAARSLTSNPHHFIG